MDPTNVIIQKLLKRFEEEAEPGYREHVAAMFNLNVENYLGVRVPVIRKVANEFSVLVKPLDMDSRIGLCQQLLVADKYELQVTAYQWMQMGRKGFRPEHLPVFEGWLSTKTKDWADCDDICTRIFGEFYLMYPAETDACLRWAESENLWFRRAAAVSLIKPVRKGKLLDVCLEIAAKLLMDKEDMVQKGYGWMLKEASKSFPDEVFSFVREYADRMPRTAFRYAIEIIPPELREEAMRWSGRS